MSDGLVLGFVAQIHTQKCPCQVGLRVSHLAEALRQFCDLESVDKENYSTVSDGLVLGFVAQVHTQKCPCQVGLTLPHLPETLRKFCDGAAF